MKKYESGEALKGRMFMKLTQMVIEPRMRHSQCDGYMTLCPVMM